MRLRASRLTAIARAARVAPTDYATTWNFFRGDAEFAKTPWAALTRSGLGTRVNSSGLIESVSIPRIDHDPVTLAARGLLVEGQASELLAATQDIAGANWTKVNSPIVTSNVATAPDGTLSADSIQSPTGPAFRYVAQLKSVAANSTVVATVFVRKETSETEYGGIALDFQGGTRKLCYIGIDAVSGAAAVLSGSGLSASLNVENFGTYWRVSAIVNDPGANTTCSAYYYANITTNLVNLTTSGVGSARVVWGLNLIVASQVSSYIPNPGTGTAVRAADDWYLSGAALDAALGASRSAFTIFVEWYQPATVGVTSRILYLGNDASTRRIDLYTSGGSVEAYVNDGTVAANIPTTPLIVNGALNKLALSVSGSSVSWAVNGVSGGSLASTFGGASSAEKLRPLHAPGASWMNSYWRRARTYPDRAMSIAEMQALTA